MLKSSFVFIIQIWFPQEGLKPLIPLWSVEFPNRNKSRERHHPSFSLNSNLNTSTKINYSSRKEVNSGTPSLPNLLSLITNGLDYCNALTKFATRTLLCWLKLAFLDKSRSQYHPSFKLRSKLKYLNYF